LCQEVLQKELTVVGEVMEQDGEAFVHFVKDPTSQILQGTKHPFSSSARVGTGRSNVLFGLLVLLRAVYATIPAKHAPAVGCELQASHLGQADWHTAKTTTCFILRQ
jgi:hypothetical protein